jgi:NAD+ kinase
MFRSRRTAAKSRTLPMRRLHDGARHLSRLRQLGLLVHPTRRIDGVLAEIGAWASANGATVGQVAVAGQPRRVADPVEAAACDLLLAIGGDGTALIALHAAAPSGRPVLGVACGSIGALASVTAERLPWALDEIAGDRWSATAVPGLDVRWNEGHGGVAINDVAIVRDGPQQAIVSITVDDVLYARVAGDGLVVASVLGSSAYSMAAGGPILAPGAEGMTITPLAPHGGSCPPLVTGTASELSLEVEPGHGGVRYELDGQRTSFPGHGLTIRHRDDFARLVRLAGEEPRLTGLRRRGLVADSPRVLVRGTRQPESGSPAFPDPRGADGHPAKRCDQSR